MFDSYYINAVHAVLYHNNNINIKFAEYEGDLRE